MNPAHLYVVGEAYRVLPHGDAEGVDWENDPDGTAQRIRLWRDGRLSLEEDLKFAHGRNWPSVLKLARQTHSLSWGHINRILGNVEVTPEYEESRVLVRKAVFGKLIGPRLAVMSAAGQYLQPRVQDVHEEGRDIAEDVASRVVVVAADVANAILAIGHVGVHGLTAEHVSTVMWPWVAVMGSPLVTNRNN